jgi:heat shock protein HtpX
LGLAIRMSAALAVIGAIYLAAAVLLVLGFIASRRSGNGVAEFGCLFFAACVPIALVGHLREGGRLALLAARARVLGPNEEPELRAIVARMAGQADIPVPAIALIDSGSPNAFAVGSSPANEVIAVTTELLERLTSQELEAVVGHEISHLENRDSMVMTFVAGPAMAGSFLWHNQDRRARFVFALYTPVYALGLLLMWTVSRYREYVADRGSALLTGAPEQLMSALEKIAGREPQGDLRGGAAISALCIVSARPRRRFELFMDHPPLDKRVRRLEELAREIGRPAR